VRVRKEQYLPACSRAFVGLWASTSALPEFLHEDSIGVQGVQWAAMATRGTDMPGCNVSRTILCFSSIVQWRRLIPCPDVSTSRLVDTKRVSTKAHHLYLVLSCRDGLRMTLTIILHYVAERRGKSATPPGRRRFFYGNSFPVTV
jgi:hypothetical protein